MRDQHSMAFQEALRKNDLEAVRGIPKADLHNHFVLGGSREYLYQKTGISIFPVEQRLKSMREMDEWSSKYIGARFDTSKGRKLLIEAAFVQAKEDSIKVLEIGEDVWGLQQFFHNDIVELIETFEEIHERIAPDIELRLQIGLSRHCPVDYLLDCLKHFWGYKEFYSIDLYGDELVQPIEAFIPIYRMAEENGLRLKAHPIKKLYRNGIDVTVNSDDILIFDSEVSKEYIRLYQSGCLTAEELDEIRLNGIKKLK